jgi:hypothetical protein
MCNVYIALLTQMGKIFHMYKEIQKGLGGNSYMRKGFQIHTVYEEIREHLVIHDFTLHPIPTKFPYFF